MNRIFTVDPAYNKFIDGAEEAMGMSGKEDYMPNYTQDFLNLEEFGGCINEELMYSSRISNRLVDDAISNPIPLLREMGKIEIKEGQKRIKPKDIVMLSAFTILIEEMKNNDYIETAELLDKVVHAYIPNFYELVDMIQENLN